MWFKKLTGFSEKTPTQVRENIRIEGNSGACSELYSEF